jgi:hypothetical protein
MIKGLAAYKEMGRKTGAEALQEIPDLVGAYSKLTPEARAMFWPHLRGVVVKSGVIQDPTQIPEQRTDEFDTIAMDFAKGLKEKEAKAPALHSVTVAGPNGQPMAKLATEAELTQGVPIYQKPEKPDTRAADKAAARTEAIDAAATSIESGQPAASVPMAIRSEAANEARRRGARVYSSDKQKTAVTALESIKKDADKVRELLDDKEIQGYLGKFATSITSTLQEWPLIGQAVPGMGEGVPDKVRQTISLLGDLTDRRLRERSGASINKDEVERISKFSLGSGLSVRTLQLNAKKLAEELNGKIEAEVGTPKTTPTAGTLKIGRFAVEVE